MTCNFIWQSILLREGELKILPISGLVYKSDVKAQPGHTGDAIAVRLSMRFNVKDYSHKLANSLWYTLMS